MKINRNLEFSIKMVLLIFMIAFLILDFLFQIYIPKKNVSSLPTIERLNIYYSFFTTQSNYLVVFYLIFALCLKEAYNKKPPFGIELAITVYITTTMFVFWLGLVSSKDEFGSYQKANWVSTIILHLIIPSIMIYYFMISSGDYYYSFREHGKLSMYGITLYPLGYLCYAMIRGEYRFRLYGPKFFSNIYTYNNGHWVSSWEKIFGDKAGSIQNANPYTSQMWFPYWFMNLHTNYTLKDVNGNVWFPTNNISQTHAILIFALACFFISAIVITAQLFYLNWNNKKFYRWHDINENLLSKEEHDYRIKIEKLNKKNMMYYLKILLIHTNTELRNWKTSLKTLSKTERKKKLDEYKSELKKTRVNERLQKSKTRLEAKRNKEALNDLLNTLSTMDRSFVKHNLREAKRLQRLVKKGVLISNNDYKRYEQIIESLQNKDNKKMP